MAQNEHPKAVTAADVAAAKAAERRCIISGDHGPRGGLIRLALDGDGVVAPDLGARAPGRGAWLTPDRALIDGAQAKGKLLGALRRAFKTQAITLPDDLGERIASGLERRALDGLGLANKAGHLIWGSERIADALNSGRAKLLIHANDAATDGTEKLRRKARGIPTLVLPLGRERLSLALGRENVVHAAVCDTAAAERVTAAVARWRAYSGLDETIPPADIPPTEDDEDAMTDSSLNDEGFQVHV
ncbi:DUF448 domain-containing protein [Glacieibacterium sp.]|uniref:DUF448 domain-containing protein n=1 Tax=Glacieibacterium sp. TaxID=2860237 RepID=UPI003AFFAEBE